MIEEIIMLRLPAISLIKNVVSGKCELWLLWKSSGAMGVVMGHELSHAFDDQGRQYDAEGNMVDPDPKSDPSSIFCFLNLSVWLSQHPPLFCEGKLVAKWNPWCL